MAAAVGQAIGNNRSSAEAFAAGTTRGGVRIFHLEPPALEGIRIIQFAASDVKSAFGIHNHPNASGLDKEIATGRRVLEVHFVLQTRATATHHSHAQDTLAPALLCQEAAHLPGGAWAYFDETL